MSRYANDQENPSYGRFFQSSPGTLDRALANAERTSARQEAIAQIENYQENIRNRQERKEKLEQLLSKGDLSPSVREQAINKVQALGAEVNYHQSQLASLIESCHGLQTHFRSRP